MLALAGCAKKSDPTTAPTVETVLTPSASPTAVPTTEPTSAPTSKPPSGPHIVYFRIKTQPRCTTSGPGGTFPGNGPTLEWKVVGATQVTLSIDGPGLFDTYPAEGSEELPFGCDGPVGSTSKHTYFLTLVGVTPEVKGQVVAQAKQL